MGECAQPHLTRGFRHGGESSIFASHDAHGFLFYLLYVAAVLVFAVLPGLERASLGRAVALGAGLGFIRYCTYDLTNLSLAKGFPAAVAVVDIIWGTVLSAVVAVAAFKLAGWVT
jgi:uncharacterized membrane protein